MKPSATRNPPTRGVAAAARALGAATEPQRKATRPGASGAVAPPPTRYQPAASGQRKAAPPDAPVAIAPPPTRYGSPARIQRKPLALPGASLRRGAQGGVLQRAATSVPDSTISWDTLVEVGVENYGLVTRESDSGDFLGAAGGGYPHFHVWREEPRKIAVSVAPNKNYKVGSAETVQIADLQIALERGVPNGGVKNLIQWVLSSAS